MNSKQLSPVDKAPLWILEPFNEFLANPSAKNYASLQNFMLAYQNFYHQVNGDS